VEAGGAAPDQVGHGSRLPPAPRGPPIELKLAEQALRRDVAELVARAGVPSATGGRW
jgi:hypothetical protein